MTQTTATVGRFSFEPARLRPAELSLVEEVRAFIDVELPRGTYRPGLGHAAGHSPGFSKKLAERGWVGMSIPSQFGGHGRTAVDRFLVAEQLLRVGAPISAHWISDRQTAPTLLAFGTEEQQSKFLPAIVSGECFFSIGMSEPDAGSDLASVQTRARRVDGGWLLNGTKIWTSNAHNNHYFVVLCRTEEIGSDRHQGLSQLIVDLQSPGITVLPIPLLDGSHHFNEVVLQDVFVPDEMVLGEVGDGWRQVTTELTFERAGPDRFLSTYVLFEQFIDERRAADADILTLDGLGRLSARLWAIRQLGLAVARAVDRSERPAIQAALVKDLGTTFEQLVVEVIGVLVHEEPVLDSSSLLVSLLAEATLNAPAFTVRGGTSEVLRMLAARGLGLG